MEQCDTDQRVRLSGGTEIAYRLSGPERAPVMVVLHALGESAASWDPVMPALAARYRVLAVDLRGHGKSSWAQPYSFEAMRDDVGGLLDALDLDRVVLVGHSMGGTVAYLLTFARPELVARLVIEDVPPPFPRTRALPQRPAGELGFDWDVVTAIAGQVNDPSRRWWPHLTEITAPMLLIAGGATSAIPQHLLIEVADAVPNCTLVTIDAGHDVHESAPGAFTDAVLDWLATAGASTGPGPRTGP